MGFEKALERTTEELKRQGFGVLTEIDVSATLKKKIDVDFRKYRILGACNPSFAYRALSAEDKVGTMLPCNVIAQELDDGRTEVAAINPVASMEAIRNEELSGIASEVQEMLKAAVDGI